MAEAENSIGFVRWPTSRKALLLGLVGMPTTLLAGVSNYIAHTLTHSAMMNLALLDPYIAAWLVVQTLVTLANWPAARAGREGRWGAYLFVAAQSPFIAGLIYLFGTMSTPLVAVFPAIGILWTLFLDERIGVFGAVCMVFWIVVAHVLEAANLLPYAPVLIERSIDAQQGQVWFISVLSHIVVLLAFCLLLCILYLRTSRLQESRLRSAHQQLENSNRLIRRYVPAQLAEQISCGNHHELSKPERRKLTIFFSDVEGFTSASEELDAEVLAQVLDQYLSEMMQIADRHGATVNQIIGDGIMIFFGAPLATDDRDHALRAVRMACEMQQRMCEMRATWHTHGLQRPFRIRIGINTGYASVGDFGSAGRKLYSGIGIQTNLAARIQAHCDPDRILITQSTWALVCDQIACVAKGEIPVKGAQYPLSVYEVAQAA